MTGYNKKLFINTSVSILALALLLATDVLAADQYMDSSEEITPGSSLTSKQQLKMRAKQGDVQAQYELGMSYRKGVGDVIIVKKPLKGIAWLEKAAEKNHIEAQIEVARMYLDLDKDGITQNADKAIKSLTKAVKANDPRAQNMLGILYRDGIGGVAKNDQEAVRWFRSSADQKFTKAQYNIAWMYEEGKGVIKDSKESFKWFHLAANQGHREAQYRVGYMYYRGEGVTKNGKEAIKWTTLAANQGLADAQSNLGEFYRTGEGVKKDRDEAIKWHTLSANQGKISSMTMLGFIYSKGVHDGFLGTFVLVQPNMQEARSWYKKAADLGDLEAQAWLLKN